MKRTAWMFLTLLAVPLPAQIQGDPREKIQEILDEVAVEMKQIDEWLLESSKTNAAATQGMKKNLERLNKLLESVGKSQKSVVKNIDDILKEAEKLKQHGSQGQPQQPGKQQGRGQRDRDERRQQQKRRLSRPENQQQANNDSQPHNRDGQEKRKGQNRDSNKPPRRATERVDAKKIEGAWGELPDYILKHGRGSMPTVPEKYRKYLEAITKEGDKKRRK